MIGLKADSEMGKGQRGGALTVKRVVEDSDRGYLNDRVEEYLPDSLFGPPTAAELAEAAQERSRRNGAPAPRRHITPAPRRKRAS
jgi:hypothetical protein